jgi:hypothetical protein
MRPWLLRALFAGTLGLGVLAGLGRADDPRPALPPLAGGVDASPLTFPAGPLPGTGPEVWAGPPGLVEPGLAPAPYPERRRPLAWLRNHPWKCWAHHNTLGCGSCQSELAFLFGSCRTFFGEPCFKGPPPPPWPPGFGAGFGPGPGGCGCP